MPDHSSSSLSMSMPKPPGISSPYMIVCSRRECWRAANSVAPCLHRATSLEQLFVVVVTLVVVPFKRRAVEHVARIETAGTSCTKAVVVRRRQRADGVRMSDKFFFLPRQTLFSYLAMERDVSGELTSDRGLDCTLDDVTKGDQSSSSSYGRRLESASHSSI